MSNVLQKIHGKWEALQMRAPEKRFNLKFNEIFASSGTSLTLTNFFHNS